jgi:ABC-type multidrug transport system fused ATPase/permease subunit
MFRYARGPAIGKALFMLLQGILPVVILMLIERIINGIISYLNGKQPLWEVAVSVAGMAICLLLETASQFVNTHLYILLQRKMNDAVNPILLNKFMSIDYSYFENRKMFDTIKCMSETPQENMIQLYVNLVDLLAKGISLIGSILIFAQARIWYIPVFFILLIPMLWCDYKVTAVMNGLVEHQSMNQRKMEYLGQLLSDKDTNFELRILQGDSYIVKKWREISKIVLDERIHVTFRGHLYYLISIPLYKIWMILVVFDLIYMIRIGQLSIGVFSVLIMSLGTLLSKSDQLSHGFQMVADKSKLTAYFDTFMNLEDVKEGEKRADISNGQVEIRFENVEFTYPDTQKKVLNNLSFCIKAGQKVALVGENGAGKSTIIKLLCRLYRPDRGKILINGIDLNAYRNEEIGKIFSVMFQDYGTYAGTLRENIAFGNLKYLHDDKKLYEAMQIGLDEKMDLNMKLGKIENDGVDLSGGQWQKVALARTNLSEAAFRILDEPTASMDPIAESKLYESFLKLTKGKGCLIVSHRLPSAKMADMILVLENGKIAEQGTHEELYGQNGIYTFMWNEQSKWYKTEQKAIEKGCCLEKGGI